MSFSLGNQTGTTTSANNPITQDFNIGANGNILVVFAESDDPLALDTAATFNGDAMTYIGGGSDGTHGYVQMYVLEAAHTGTCQFSVANPNGNVVRLVMASFISSTGAAALSRQNNGGGTSTNPSLNVTGTVANSLMVGMCVDGYRNQVAKGANYTTLNQRDAGNWTFHEEYDLDSGAAGTIAVNFVLSTSDSWYIVAAAFKEATAARNVSLKPAYLSLQGETIGVSPGEPPAQNINLKVAIISLQGQATSISAPLPTTQVNLKAALLHLSGENASVGKGAVSIPLKVAQLALTGKAIVLQKGAVTINLDPALLNLSPKSLVVQKGGVLISLDPALLSLTGKSISVGKGAVTISLDPALLSLSGKQAQIDAPAPGNVQVNLQPARLSLSGKSSTILKGSVSISLDPALLRLDGRHASISMDGSPITISLRPALLNLSGKNVSISAPAPGSIQVNLQSARLSLSGKSINIGKGAVSVSLDPALLRLSGEPISISVPTTQVIHLDPAMLHLDGGSIIASPYIPPAPPAPSFTPRYGGRRRVIVIHRDLDRKRKRDEEDILINH